MLEAILTWVGVLGLSFLLIIFNVACFYDRSEKEKKMKGFTLIEVIVVCVIIALISAIAIPIVMSGKMPTTGKVSYGINGMTETRCIEGFKFIVGSSGSTQQLLDQNGKGVPCTQ